MASLRRVDRERSHQDLRDHPPGRRRERDRRRAPDLLGLNFVPELAALSSTSGRAATIAERVAGRVELVGVFQNAEHEEIERVRCAASISTALQFHGERD